MKEESVDINNRDCISISIAFLKKNLENTKLDKKEALKVELLCEESILKLKKYMLDDGNLDICIKRVFGGTVLELKTKGELIPELSEGGNISYAANVLDNEDDEIDTGFLILKANDNIVKYSHRDGSNIIKIKLGKDERSTMYLTLFSLVSAVILGFIFRAFVPEIVTNGLCDYLLSPIKTMFINALKIVVGPVVFFSIVTCISGFTNMAELGKIGAKVMALYTTTTVIAVIVGFQMFNIINPGQEGMALESSVKLAQVNVDTSADTSILSTIINIVPSNLLKPFVETDTLQIIFLAVLLGAAAGMIGNYSRVIQDIFEACNELFLTVTTLIAKLIPLAVFCAIFVMVCQTGSDSLVAMFGMAGTDVLAFGCMMIVYGLLILIIGRINPLIFYKKNWSGMITAFSLSSSNAAMPTNMKICTNKLGISPKVCNFSIPLGATVNMDGVSIHLAIASMFLAKVYGVEIPSSALVSLILTIVMLSLGAPGVPGSSLVCLGVILQQLGVPIEAIGLIMGVDSLLDMFRTVSNTTGDMAVTLIVAKSENLLDMEKYLS